MCLPYLRHTITYHASSSIHLCSLLIFFTGPPSPLNITVGSITISQISVHWTLPEPLKAGWMFIVRYVHMYTRQDGILRVANFSRISGLQSYSAVIGGLESYRKYRVEVYTVTQWGIESCEQEPVTVQTGEHVTDFLHSRHFADNLMTFSFCASQR